MLFDVVNLVIAAIALGVASLSMQANRRRVTIQEREFKRGERDLKLREAEVKVNTYGFWNRHDHAWFPEDVPGLEIVLVNPSERPIRLISLRGKTPLGYVNFEINQGQVDIEPESSVRLKFRGDIVAGQLERMRFRRDKDVCISLEGIDELGNSFFPGDIHVIPDAL
jgi:hypothetical protein